MFVMEPQQKLLASTSKIIDNIDNIPFFNNNTRSMMSVTSKVDWLKTANSLLANNFIGIHDLNASGFNAWDFRYILITKANI